MQLLIKPRLTVFVAMFLALPVLCLVGGKANAQTNTQSQAPAQQNNQKNTNSTVTYSYVAQAGDSYSVMARKAVQTYGKKFKTNINQAQIIFAETNLTQQAGSPILNLGQKVSLSESTIKQWVQNAQKLTTAQIAAWNYYAQFADFNTNKVGQA